MTPKPQISPLKFPEFRKRVAKAESWDLGQTRPVGEEFSELSVDENVEQELADLKKRMKQKSKRHIKHMSPKTVPFGESFFCKPLQ